MFKGLKPIHYGGREVWPLVEGGKGVSATNHASSGAWAAAGGIGTVSAVNADSYDPEGRIIPQVYKSLTRKERQQELIHYGIEGAVAQIDRAFGKGSAMKLGSREKIEIDTVSTGSLGLDIALGVGSLPRGRVIEIYGPESSGKTTLALHAIAEAQKTGGTAAFIDAEHALDPGYAKKLGVNIDELIVSQPEEQPNREDWGLIHRYEFEARRARGARNIDEFELKPVALLGRKQDDV